MAVEAGQAEGDLAPVLLPEGALHARAAVEAEVELAEGVVLAGREEEGYGRDEDENKF